MENRPPPGSASQRGLTQIHVALALAKLGDRERATIRVIRRAVKDVDKQIRMAAEKTLSSIDEKSK